MIPTSPNIGPDVATGRRWVLLEETQACIWGSADAMPAVDIEGSVELEHYRTPQDALRAVEDYLTVAGATAQWSDVRPIETCACCDADFDTTKWHKVLTLTVEEGPLDDPEVLDEAYPARFCNSCVSVNISRLPA